MDERTKTLQQQLDCLSGEVTALSLAVHVLLKTHPDRASAAALIRCNIEAVIADALATAMPDEHQHGLEAVRDLFLLKKKADPGQPSRS